MAEQVFVADDNTAVLECPQCGKAKRVDVSRYNDIQQAVKIRVKCSCRHIYNVSLERRKSFRKNVNFPGTYTHVLPDFREDKGGITVKDLSRSGLKIKLNAEKEFKPGDILFVEFQLDDQQRSLVKKDAIVKKKSDSYLGLEFKSIDSSDPSDKAIGFYMLA